MVCRLDDGRKSVAWIKGWVLQNGFSLDNHETFGDVLCYVIFLHKREPTENGLREVSDDIAGECEFQPISGKCSCSHPDCVQWCLSVSLVGNAVMGV